MHDLLAANGDIIPPDDPDFETGLEAERDMQLLAFVFDQLRSQEQPRTFKDLVKKLVDDSVLPNQDRTQSTGRNAAFELFVGAICTSAQLHPVGWDEPDVTCTLDGVKYGFAAKRVKSVKSLDARVRKAVEQIERSKMPGIIVLDTCLAFNPDNIRITEPLPDSVFMERYWKGLQHIWSRFNPKVQRMMSNRPVLGVIVHDYQVRFQLNQQWGLVGMTMRVTSETCSNDNKRRFETLSALYTYAMPNQEDVSDPKLVLP